MTPPSAPARRALWPTALTLALTWGLNWPAIKIALGAVPPFTLRALGLGSGALLLMGLAWAQGRRIVPPRDSWAGIAIAGALTVVVFNFSTAFAQLNTSTSRAAVLTYTMPTLSALLAWPLLGERPGRRGMLAVVLGALGILLLAWPALSAAQGASMRGPGFALLAALAWALGTIVTKRLPPVHDRVVATAWQLGLGGACGFAASWWAAESAPRGVSWAVAAALVYHIVIATAFAYVLWYRLLDSASVTVSSLTTLAVPVVGVLGAMALVGDRPSLPDWLGFALVLAGAALVVLKRR